MGNGPKANHKPTHLKSSNFRKWLMGLGLMLAPVLLASPQAAAEMLDKDAMQKLPFQGVWVADHPEWGNWSWNKDKTVCLRIDATEGKCADTGTWAIKDNVLCYELTWGNSTDNRKDCFTVQANGDGRYETLYHGGAMVSTIFHFKVLE